MTIAWFGIGYSLPTNMTFAQTGPTACEAAVVSSFYGSDGIQYIRVDMSGYPGNWDRIYFADSSTSPGIPVNTDGKDRIYDIRVSDITYPLESTQMRINSEYDGGICTSTATVAQITGTSEPPENAEEADPCDGLTGAPLATCQCEKKGTANDPIANERCIKTTLCEYSGRDHVFTPAFNNGCFTLPEFFTTVLNYLMTFAGVIAAFMFVRGSYGVLVSKGNPAALVEARDMLTQALIGLIIIATAYGVVNFLGTAFNSLNLGIDLTPFF